MFLLTGIFQSAGPLLAAPSHRHAFVFSFDWSPQYLLALIAGLLVLVRPKNLNLIVAGYLILLGLLGIFHISW